MLETATAVKPVRPFAPIAGVTAPNRRAQDFERRIALVVVITPFIGLIAAAVMFWQRGVSLLDLCLLAGMYSITSIGIGIGYHRLISHASFRTPSWLRGLFGIFGSMAVQGPVLYWAAIHRRHHSCSDRPGDPHSPHLDRGPGVSGLLAGLWHAHTGWLFVHEITDWSHYILDLLRDQTLYLVNRLYFVWVLLGLAIPTVLGGALTGTWMGALTGLLWGGLIRIFLVHHVTWAVNSICHVYGSTPYRAPDESRNNIWLALPSFGEGWHNNHHAFPYSSRHGLHWWQFDLNALIIRGLSLLGLAWNLKAPTARMLQEARTVPTPEKNVA